MESLLSGGGKAKKRLNFTIGESHAGVDLEKESKNVGKYNKWYINEN